MSKGPQLAYVGEQQMWEALNRPLPAIPAPRRLFRRLHHKLCLLADVIIVSALSAARWAAVPWERAVAHVVHAAALLPKLTMQPAQWNLPLRLGYGPERR